jgi:hypothetical protein
VTTVPPDRLRLDGPGNGQSPDGGPADPHLLIPLDTPLEVALTEIDPGDRGLEPHGQLMLWHATQGGVRRAQAELYRRESAYRAAFGNHEDLGLRRREGCGRWSMTSTCARSTEPPTLPTARWCRGLATTSASNSWPTHDYGCALSRNTRSMRSATASGSSCCQKRSTRANRPHVEYTGRTGS